jgi:hypothetical protein
MILYIYKSKKTGQLCSIFPSVGLCFKENSAYPSLKALITQVRMNVFQLSIDTAPYVVINKMRANLLPSMQVMYRFTGIQGLS